MSLMGPIYAQKMILGFKLRNLQSQKKFWFILLPKKDVLTNFLYSKHFGPLKIEGPRLQPMPIFCRPF